MDDRRWGSETQELLHRTADLAIDYLRELPDRPVRPPATLEQLRESLGGPLNEDGEAPTDVIETLVRRADPGVMASSGPRFFGFVIGGGLPAAVAADWLTSAWDSGLVIVRDPEAHRAAMMMQAGYLMPASGDERDPSDWVPEFSRRARGWAVYAALRSLGRRGVADLIDGCCRLARRMADRLDGTDGIEVMNDVVLNQVLVRFGGDDALTRDVVRRVQEDGTCWLSGSTWHGRAVMRISVSNWSTTDDDADRSVDAILRCHAAAVAALAKASAPAPL
jgi:hypothetical protein